MKGKRNEKGNSKPQVKRQQPRKDSRSKRVNFDNERLSKVEDKIHNIGKTCASNDVSWYANNPELLRSAASLAFSQTTGTMLQLDDGSLNQFVALSTVPGVMQIQILPAIGGWSDDAVNAAKNSIYSFVVHANSRNTSYDSTDLMNVILAGSQIFSAIGSAIRAYGTMRTFDQRNKYLPIGLIQAMGFNYHDLQANLSKMWFDINELIARSSQIWIPNTMPFLDRWFWINSNIYQDSASVKGQYYVMAQNGFWAYDETIDAQGGGLTWIKPDGTLLSKDSAINTANRFRPADQPATWTQFMTAINGMINALLNSEDRGVMMGDMLKAYGSDKIYALKPIPVDYQVVPQYDTEVLTQIENCSVYSSVYTSIRQEQTTLKLYTNWGVAPSGSSLTQRACAPREILNFHQKETPSPEQVMVATRLKCLGMHVIPDPTDTSKVGTLCPDTMGTEYVLAINCFGFNKSGLLSIVNYVTHQTYATTLDTFVTYMQEAFDWSPWIYLTATFNGASGDPVLNFKPLEVMAGLGDYDMYTVVDALTLKKMHTTAVYSEFGVPTI